MLTILGGGSMSSLQAARRRFLARAAVACLLPGALLLGGCGSATSGLVSSTGKTMDTAAATMPQPAQVGADGVPVQKLANGDKVRITVFNEPTLSGEYVVDSYGKLSYPLVGELEARGLSGAELERTIATKLKGRFLVNPQVTLEVLSMRPVYVIGEVKAPGEYAFRQGMNVVSAIALAGGFSPRANDSFVYLKRQGAKDEQRQVDLANIFLQPGDIIRVQERYF